MAARAKRLAFELDIDRAGRLSAEGCPPLQLPQEWQAEHLLLAGLARCSLTSLRYHAQRVGADAVGGGEASGVVTKRDSDGRYAFVEIAVQLDVEIEPAPGAEELTALLGKAERDCFVAASLSVAPAYRWLVNGREVAAAAT
jgi:organic hydroperoxide reductase OsmC/OhrA